MASAAWTNTSVLSFLVKSSLNIVCFHFSEATLYSYKRRIMFFLFKSFPLPWESETCAMTIYLRYGELRLTGCPKWQNRKCQTHCNRASFAQNDRQQNNIHMFTYTYTQKHMCRGTHTQIHTIHHHPFFSCVHWFNTFFWHLRIYPSSLSTTLRPKMSTGKVTNSEN